MAKRIMMLAYVCKLLLGCVPLPVRAADGMFNVPFRSDEGVIITPLSIRVSDGKASHSDPGTGKVFVLVALQVTNQTGGTYFFSDMNLAARVDGKILGMGNMSNVMLDIMSNQMYRGGYGVLPAEFMPQGTTAEGEIGWVVDADWKKLEIDYSFEEFGTPAKTFTFTREDAEGKPAAGSGMTELYRADFDKPGMDGWFTNGCSSRVTMYKEMMVAGRTQDWNGPNRIFNLKPGVEYRVSVEVYQRGAASATFLVTVAQDGANWVNLAAAVVPKAKWTTLEATFMLDRYNEYDLYVETYGAPTLSFLIRNFTIHGPKGGL